MRPRELGGNQPIQGRTLGHLLQPSRLLIKLPQRKQRVRPVELCLVDRAPEHADGLVIDLERNRERVPVLAAVGEGKARRIAEPARRAVYDFGDQGQRPHRTGADAGREQQISKVGWSALGGGGKIAVQTPQLNILRPDVVMSGQGEMRQCRLRRLLLIGWNEACNFARNAVWAERRQKLDLFAPGILGAPIGEIDDVALLGPSMAACGSSTKLFRPSDSQ